MEYKVMKGYSRWDNTLNENDVERIEYAAHIVPFKFHKDAREYLKHLADKNGMRLGDNAFNLTAEKEEIKFNEETGIKVIEKNYLYIKTIA